MPYSISAPTSVSSGAATAAPAAFAPWRQLGGSLRIKPFVFNRRLSLWVAVLLLFSFWGPAEAILRVGLGFTALRAALFAALIPTLPVLMRKLTRGAYVPVLSDFMIIALAFWMALAIVATSGPKTLFGIGGADILQFLSAYLAARVFFGTKVGLEQFVQVLLIVAIGLVVLGLLEIAAHENIVGRMAEKIFHTSRGAVTQYRMGFVRVRVSFEHSILYGAFFAVAAPIFMYALKSAQARLIALGTCTLGTIISFSSGPILCFVFFLGAVAFDTLFRAYRWRWPLFGLLIVFALALVMLTVDDPIETLIRTFTLDPQTGLYRLQIWHWIGYNLQDAWLFGRGNQDWIRPPSMVPSVDSLWLMHSLRSGYVGLVLLVASILGVFLVWTPRPLPAREDESYAHLRVAVTVSIFQIVFLAFAVHIWGIMWAFLAMLLGIRAGLNEARFIDPVALGDEVPPPVRRSRIARLVAAR